MLPDMLTVDVTEAPPTVLRSVNVVPETPCTCSLNVAVTELPVDTLTAALAGVRLRTVGATESVGACGVTGEDGSLSLKCPPEPLARTWKVNVVPLVRPPTTAEFWSPATVTLVNSVPPVNALTSKEVTSAPPGSAQVTRAAPLRANAVMLTGAAGARLLNSLTAWSWKASHTFVTGSLSMQNRRFSMFHSVSMPSPFGNGVPPAIAAASALSATVTLPSALAVMSYRSVIVDPAWNALTSWPNTAVSQLVTPAV